MGFEGDLVLQKRRGGIKRISTSSPFVAACRAYFRRLLRTKDVVALKEVLKIKGGKALASHISEAVPSC